MSSTSSRAANKRSKSQLCPDKSKIKHRSSHNHNHKFDLKNHIDRVFTNNLQGQFRRCQCCNDRVRYPDYLDQMRRKRIERMERKRIAQAFMHSNIPMIESKKQSSENISEKSIHEQTNFAPKTSNKVPQYENTPKKSILQSFHEGIINSHTNRTPKKEMGLSSKKHSSKKDQQFEYKFEVMLENSTTGQTYYRSFSAPEYGVLALQYIQDIFSKAT